VDAMSTSAKTPPLYAALPETFATWDLCVPYANPSGGTCPESGSLHGHARCHPTVRWGVAVSVAHVTYRLTPARKRLL